MEELGGSRSARLAKDVAKSSTSKMSTITSLVTASIIVIAFATSIVSLLIGSLAMSETNLNSGKISSIHETVSNIEFTQQLIENISMQIPTILSEAQEAIEISNTTTTYAHQTVNTLNTTIINIQQLIQNFTIPEGFNVTSFLTQLNASLVEARSYSNYSEYYYQLSAYYANFSEYYQLQSQQWTSLSESYAESCHNDSIVTHQYLDQINLLVNNVSVTVNETALFAMNAAIEAAQAAYNASLALNYTLATANFTNLAQEYALEAYNYSLVALSSASNAMVYETGALNYAILAYNYTFQCANFADNSLAYAQLSYNYSQLSLYYADYAQNLSISFPTYVEQCGMYANNSNYYLAQVLATLTQTMSVKSDMIQIFANFNATVNFILNNGGFGIVNGSLNENTTNLLYEAINSSIITLQYMDTTYDYYLQIVAAAQTALDEKNIACNCSIDACTCSDSAESYMLAAQTAASQSSIYYNNVTEEVAIVAGLLNYTEYYADQCLYYYNATLEIAEILGLDSSGNLVFESVKINGTSDQILFRQTYTTAIQVQDPGQDTTVTLPDPGVPNTSFVLTDGNQLIHDTKTFDGNINLPNLSAGSVLVIDGSETVTGVQLGQGETLVGVASSAPVAGSLLGTANQINVNSTTGNVTFSLPQDIDATASPTFSQLTLSSLSPNSVVVTGSDGKFQSVVLQDGDILLGYSDAPPGVGRFIGNPGSITVTNSPGQVQINTIQDVSPDGAPTFNAMTLSTFTATGVLVSSGSGVISDVHLTDGQIIIGSTSGQPAAGTITGTTNQIQVTNAANSITLSLPPTIATSSTLQVTSAELTSTGSDALVVQGQSTFEMDVTMHSTLEVSDVATFKGGLKIGGDGAYETLGTYIHDTYTVDMTGLGWILTSPIPLVLEYQIVGNVVTITMPTTNAHCNGSLVHFPLPAVALPAASDTVDYMAVGMGTDTYFVPVLIKVTTTEAQITFGLTQSGVGFTFGNLGTSALPSACQVRATTFTYSLT